MKPMCGTSRDSMKVLLIWTSWNPSAGRVDTGLTYLRPVLIVTSLINAIVRHNLISPCLLFIVRLFLRDHLSMSRSYKIGNTITNRTILVRSTVEHNINIYRTVFCTVPLNPLDIQRTIWQISPNMTALFAIFSKCGSAQFAIFYRT